MSEQDALQKPQSNPPTNNNHPSIDRNSELTSLEYLLQNIFKPTWLNWVATITLTTFLLIHYYLVTCSFHSIFIDLTRLFTCIIAAFFIACKIFSAYNSKELITDFFKNHPLQLFVSIIACGATTAFFLPLILNLFKFIGETDKLTTALLASTGGVIAVFTLIKTHQKNQTDEATLEHNKAVHAQQVKDRNYDIERQISERKEQKEQFDRNFNLQSSKNKQDHIHQAHAERRSRYTKAIEQLAHEKAAVRLGGIYTLVGLVDEWLADKSIKDKDDRRKEGQVIINNLCSYIRSPFKLAEKRATLESDTQPDNYQGNFFEDQVKLFEEQDVRRSIFNEMSTRIHPLNEEEEEEKLDCITWDVFEFNFQKSTVFYPLNRLTFFSQISEILNFSDRRILNFQFSGESRYFREPSTLETLTSQELISKGQLFSKIHILKEN